MPPLSSWVIHFLFVGFLFFFGGICDRLIHSSPLDSSSYLKASYQVKFLILLLNCLFLSLSLLLVISLGFLCQIAGELNRLPLHIRPAFNEQIVANRGKSFQGEFHAITLGEMFSTANHFPSLPSPYTAMNEITVNAPEFILITASLDLLVRMILVDWIRSI